MCFFLRLAFRLKQQQVLRICNIVSERKNKILQYMGQCKYLISYFYHLDCEYIKAVETKHANGKKLPLCIMVSNDTKGPTIKLLNENKCYGLDKEQLFLVEQGAGVPALSDNNAKFSMDQTNSKVLTKPHGHGDIHALLYNEGIIRKWKKDFDVNYVVLFQDTNGLAFHTLPLMLGVSEKLGFIMNSLAIPRKAKQAIGGIAKLKNAKSGAQR